MFKMFLSVCPRPESLRSIGFQITLRDGISQLPDLMVNGFIKRWLGCANAKPLNPTRYRCQPLPGGGKACPALPFIPSRLQRNGHCEESPLGEFPATVDVATGVRIFQLRCQYAYSRKYHLP